MEENVNDVLGIETPKTAELSATAAKVEEFKINHTASKGLSYAAIFCDITMWVCLVMAFAAAIAYLSESGDLDSYSDYTRIRVARDCAIASTCFTYGIVGAISCFITSKFLRGIGVITKAAEHYLGTQTDFESKSQPTKEANE